MWLDNWWHKLLHDRCISLCHSLVLILRRLKLSSQSGCLSLHLLLLSIKFLLFLLELSQLRTLHVLLLLLLSHCLLHLCLLHLHLLLLLMQLIL